MAFDFSKIKNNRVLQVIAILAVPTVIVGVYYGYVYLKKRSDEKKAELRLAELSKPQAGADMVAYRNSHKEINTVDDFIAGVQYAEHRLQFGYNVTQLSEHKPLLEKMGMVKLKRLYDLINIAEKTNAQDEEFLNLMHEIYP